MARPAQTYAHAREEKTGKTYGNNQAGERAARRLRVASETAPSLPLAVFGYDPRASPSLFLSVDHQC
jgi:hypothetical protein